MSVDYCGIPEHDDDCLCDVVIPHPTGWVTDAVKDMWLGYEIVDMMGYRDEWDDDDILRYLQDLTYAKDHWAGALFEEQPKHGKTAPALLRQEIARRLQSSETKSIADVCEELGLSHKSLMYVLFTGRRMMPMQELLEFESDVRNRVFPSAYGLGIKYGMPYKSAHKLHSYWGVPYGVGERRPPETVVMDEILLSTPDIKYSEVAEQVYKRTGIVVQIDRVRTRKYLLRKNNKL